VANTRFSLDGKVAVVTGAAGLLGVSHCLALAEAGASVVAVDLQEDRCARLALELRAAHGRDAYAYVCDVTSPPGVAGLLDAVLQWFGRVDVLINNAAIDDKVEKPASGGQPRFEDYPLDAWDRCLKVNVTGTFVCCQSIGAEMARRRRGSIINIASTYGIVAPDQSLYRNSDGTQTFFKSAAYPTTKGAVLALTRFLGAYWGRVGVRVNALSPGGVENGQSPEFVTRYSERTPLGRMAHASDYAGALIFLASDASDYVTGANLIVDGGWTAW